MRYRLFDPLCDLWRDEAASPATSPLLVANLLVCAAVCCGSFLLP